jgi:SM-20-related protein
MLDRRELSDLRERGMCRPAALLPAALFAALAEDCATLHAAGAMRPAAVGRGNGRLADPSLRGDALFWIEATASAPARQALLMQLDTLRRELNRHLFLGLHEVEAHYAVYPPGSGYRRHRDRFRDDDARVLSFTAYLNADWHDEAGGQLRLYLPDGPLDIAPRLGTCTLFLSAEIEHEVLPATRPRQSIAGWFRRRGGRGQV